MERCHWVNDDPLYLNYHDEEWGVPCYDDKKLFEFLTLEGAQAGLNWYIILKKRPYYREAFFDFSPKIICNLDSSFVEQTLKNSQIVRNRRKILSVIGNAQAFTRIQEQYGSFSSFIWSFVDNHPIVNHWTFPHEVPAFSPLSIHVSKALKAQGFSFVGPTIMYSYLQAIGMVMDHIISCFRYEQLR